MNTSARLSLIAGVLVCLLLSSVSISAEEEGIQLPASQKQWLNDGPYWGAALKDKTIVLYFFEEQ